ncbi:MAG: C25 family cysteine peptidase [Thermoplasmatota archaeon]
MRKESFEYRCGTGILKDKRVLYLSIVIYPVQYDLTKQSITWIDSVDYSIQYKLPDEQFLPKKKYETLIISPSNFSDELQPLLQLSNLTYLINLSEIPKLGRDAQENIKYFIKNAIEQWEISNVLLVGGYHQIPCRMVHVDDIRSVIMGEKNFISDLYYADIYDEKGSFCSWDSNNNGLYGEYKLFSHSPVDELDLYPDVHLGRFACTSEKDVSTVVNKTIQYVTDNSYESSWFQHVIAIGGDTFTEDIAGISEGEKINDAIIKIMASFSSTKLWGSNDQLKHAEDISNEIENGAGFVFFEGHAGSNSYRTHPNKARNQWIPVEWYRTYHVNSLRNEKKLPIITINACNTCKFQVDHTSLGWSFIVNPHGGGIASIGMTCLSWIYPGVFCTQGLGGEIHQNAYKAYMNGAETFGEFWSSSIIQYLNSHPWSLSVYDYKTIESWQPFGYPSLKIASVME